MSEEESDEGLAVTRAEVDEADLLLAGPPLGRWFRELLRECPRTVPGPAGTVIEVPVTVNQLERIIDDLEVKLTGWIAGVWEPS